MGGGNTTRKRAKKAVVAEATAASIELTGNLLLPLPEFADIRPHVTDVCVRRTVFPEEAVSNENVVGWRAVVTAKKVDKSKVSRPRCSLLS